MKWVRTLRGQFVAVTAISVIFSNLTVILVLEVGRQDELSGARRNLLLDRVATSFDLISEISASQQELATQVLSGRYVRYRIVSRTPIENTEPSDEEIQIANTVRNAERATNPGELHVRLTPIGQNLGSTPPLVEIAQALPDGAWVLVSLAFPAPPLNTDLFIAAAFATVLTCAAAAWLAGRVSRPLSELAAAADQVAHGNQWPYLKEEGPDDLQRAAAAFNAMNRRVSKTLENHRQLLSAVGHDLRTPITAMRISAEFVQDEDVQNRLVRNLDELQWLTEAVLAAARSEQQGEDVRLVDLAALVQSLCEDLSDLGKTIQMNIEGVAPSMCRPHELRRAVRNLMENALRYGDCAHVSFHKENDEYLIIIEDEGPGVPEDKLKMVFDPFVRLEESRSSQTGGTGLGLTLALSIIKGHDGEIVLENRQPHGLRVIVRLPRKTGVPVAAQDARAAKTIS